VIPFLNLADHLSHFAVSTLNGPGLRYVLFVQGCSHRCTMDCLNEEYIVRKPRVLVPVTEVAEYILELKRTRGIEGVTFLGGEPFDQAEALAELGATLRQADLSVVTYTGFLIEYLRKKPRAGWLELLAVTDLLIDGPFLPQYYSDTLRWRGSSNQRLIYLSARYDAQLIEAQPLEKGFNLILRPDGTVKLSGMQSKRQAEGLMQTLRDKGVIQ